MSNALLPLPAGLGWDIHKTPNFSTIVQRAVSGREVRSPLYVTPLWDFEFVWKYLKDAQTFSSAPGGNTTTASTASGSYPATTYYVQTTWVLPGGESLPSTESSQAVTASHLLTVKPTGSAPAGTLGYNVYVGLWSGGEVRQNALPIDPATTWTQPTTGLVNDPGGLRQYIITPPAFNSDLQTLLGFYLARQGQYDSFLFADPTDNSVSLQSFGTGDGTTTAFQLGRVYGGFAEAIQNPFQVAIFDNGTQKSSGYTVGTLGTVNGGLVTFTTAPTAGHALTWSGSFFFRLRFKDDNSEFNQFLTNLYEHKGLDCTSVKL